MNEYLDHQNNQLQDEIPFPNVITFQQWQTLKQYGNITRGVHNFSPEDLDQLVVFFDNKMEYIDYLERVKVENITPGFVLLPRFFWEHQRDLLPEDFLPGMKIPERVQLLNTTREYWANLESRALAGTDLYKLEVEPREEQKPVLNFFQERMQNKHRIRGILQAPPGTGKTIMSISIAGYYRARTLVVVPNEVLADQWTAAIMSATDLKEDQIGILQGSDLDKLEKVLFDKNKKIFIVKIQSLFSQVKHNHIYQLQQFYKYIDLVIYDECHNTGSATSYAKTSSLFLTPNILGLSATPYRVGLNEYLLKTSIGDVIYKLEHNNLTPNIEIHNVWTDFTEKESSRLASMMGDYVMFLGIFNSMMKGKNQYFEYLADVVNYNISLGHNIVVLFPTIFMQEKLQHYIQVRHPEISPGVLLLKGKTKQDSLELVKEERKKIMNEFKDYKQLLDDRVKAKEIKRKEAQALIKERRKEIDARVEFLKDHALDLYQKAISSAQVIVSNYNLLSAGFDKAELSNIIFGGAPRIGKVSVIQSIGRITRKHESKNHPLVQYFIPSKFLEMQKSTGVILNKNIRVQYPDAEFKYIGFREANNG